MSHPSIFELRHFAVSGDLDEVCVAHVSGCAPCSERLQRLAQSELRARGRSFDTPFGSGFSEVSKPSTARAIPTFLMMTATMLVLSLVRPAAQVSSVSPSLNVDPEGVHGVSYPRVAEQVPAAWVDGGARVRDEQPIETSRALYP